MIEFLSFLTHIRPTASYSMLIHQTLVRRISYLIVPNTIYTHYITSHTDTLISLLSRHLSFTSIDGTYFNIFPDSRHKKNFFFSLRFNDEVCPGWKHISGGKSKAFINFFRPAESPLSHWEVFLYLQPRRTLPFNGTNEVVTHLIRL